LKIFNDFSRDTHGHGGHEHGVRREVFGGKLSLKKMSAGGRLCTLQENPNFWVPKIKVRPPDGTSRLLTFFFFFLYVVFGFVELGFCRVEPSHVE
jgi:hypothetical protein